MKKFTVTLTCIIEDRIGEDRSGTYDGETRYEAVAKAFADLCGGNQAALLNEWKVLDAREVNSDFPDATT